MDNKYLFIITLLFFIQPNWAELECETEVGCKKTEIQARYSIFVLLIVLQYLK